MSEEVCFFLGPPLVVQGGAGRVSRWWGPPRHALAIEVFSNVVHDVSSAVPIFGSSEKLDVGSCYVIPAIIKTGSI
jgi:hypothetical protein